VPAVSAWDGLFFIVKGEGWLEMEQCRYDALPGDLFFWRAGRHFSAGHNPRRPVTVYSAGFTLRGMKNMDIFRPFVLPERLRLPSKASREIEACYQTLIHDCRDRSPHARLSARGAFLRLIAEALRLADELPAESKTASPPALPGEETRASKVISFIDANLNKRLTLPKLAAVAHLSPIYFAKLFHRQTGMAPMAYVRMQRVEEAKRMLLSSDETVERIAEAVGFEDPFHFSRIFRRLTGQAPSAYRSSFKNPFSS
jgi:AraC-like DNA-binding protein